MAAQRRAWETNALAWIDHVADSGGFRELLDPYVLRFLGPIPGRSFLDAGCGEGRFSRRLAEGGASRVLGVDLATALVRAARAAERAERRGRPGRERVRPVYRVGDAAVIRPGERFDGIVAYLSLMHFPDPLRALRAWRQALAADGVLVAVLPHPFTQAPGSAWQGTVPPVPGTEPGRLESFRAGDYFAAGWQSFRFPGPFRASTENFHRPLGAWADLFRRAGLAWTNLAEPRPSARAARLHPEWMPLRDVPYFLVIQAARSRASRDRGIC